MRVLIVEDEPLAARRLGKILLNLRPEIQIVGQTSSIVETLEWLAAHPEPDLLLLDVHLSDGNSFEIFRHQQLNAPIIFTTAYDQYALDAFRVHALDYLLKPIKQDALAEALARVPTLNTPVSKAKAYQHLAALAAEGEKRFLIKIGQQIKIVPTKEVAYLYTEQKVTFLITFAGRRYPLDYTLEKLEEILPPDRFFRINRQFIVAMEAIEEMYASSKSRVKLLLRPSCPLDTTVSTEKSPLFKQWLRIA